MRDTDFLVIGSGVAGLTFAVKIASQFPEKSVVIVTKSNEDESNTKYAQGGVAVVSDEKADSFDKHIQDTVKAGDGLCDEEVVKLVVKEGPKLLKELIVWGAKFDLDDAGSFDLGKEGGHSEYRVVHHKDITGYEVERALLQRVHLLDNIEVLAHHFAIDLITNHQISNGSSDALSCYGAYVLNQNTQEILTIRAASTLLASGGIGQVYGHTTNPAIATGDGIAMAYRAKAKIRDMEFVQFHPTALYSPQKGPSFLISEAVRGFGAFLRTKDGRRFMTDYDPRAELASRDIVSQSIDSELKKSGDLFVYLDCTHLDIPGFKRHFPNIYEKCLQAQIDIEKDWIPVVPAAHYLCGGIVVNIDGMTSVSNLYACGECSQTGLHGANRLASNSLLEALVFADRIYQYLSKNAPQGAKKMIPGWDDSGVVGQREQVIIQHNLREVQELMRNYVGIVRSNSRLKKAIVRLDVIYREVEEFYTEFKVSSALCELRNMVNIAHLVISQSIERKENRGGYLNIDNKK